MGDGILCITITQSIFKCSLLYIYTLRKHLEYTLCSIQSKGLRIKEARPIKMKKLKSNYWSNTYLTIKISFPIFKHVWCKHLMKKVTSASQILALQYFNNVSNIPNTSNYWLSNSWCKQNVNWFLTSL